MGTRVLLNEARREFYCWWHYRWFRCNKLKYCCTSGCRKMEVPPALRWKVTYLGGVLVPAGG